MEPAEVASCRAVFSASLLAKETADGPASWEDVNVPVLGDTKLKISRGKHARRLAGERAVVKVTERTGFCRKEGREGAALSTNGWRGRN